MYQHLSRRLFIQRAPLTAAGMVIAVDVALLSEGCTVGDAVINILNLMEPAVAGVLPIVALADPSLQVPVQAVITTFDSGVTLVTNLYHQYEATVAAGSPNPTFLQEFKSALSTLNTDTIQILTVAHVTDPAHATLIQDIVSALTQEIATIISMFTPVASAAMAHTTVITIPSVAHAKAEQKAFKARLYAIYSRQTGDAALDAQTAKTAKQFK